MEWLVFSGLDQSTAQTLQVGLAAQLEAILSAHPEVSTRWDCAVVKSGPKGVERPEGTKSVFRIEGEDDPVIISMMRVLLERCDPIEVDWGDGERDSGIAALATMRTLEGPLEEEVEPPDDEETLFERVLEAIMAASEDMERSVELKEAFEEASPQARAWMEHVVRNRVSTDAAVDLALGLVPPASERVHREIQTLLAELGELAD